MYKNIRLFRKPSSFARILRCAICSNAHVLACTLRFSQIVRLVFKQNTWFLKKSILSVLLILCASSSLAAKIEPLDRVIAVVNDQVITQAELNTELRAIVLQAQQAQIDLPDQKTLVKQVLDQLIDVKLQEQLAERWEIRISDAEVDQAVANILERNQITLDGMKAALQEEGMDFETYKNQIKRQILISRIQQQAIRPQVTITDKEVQRYRQLMEEQTVYNQEFFVENILIALPEAPTTEEVKAAEEKAKALLAEIRAGKPFHHVAMSDSDDQFALQGGELGWRQLAGLPEIFAEPIKSMKKGDLKGPIRAGNGFHLIHLKDVRGGEQKQYINEYHLRHLLLKGDTLLSDDLLKLQLQDIRKQLNQGMSFVELVEIYSQEPVTASKQGDMGWLKSFELPESMRFAVEKLNKGQVSQPIKTSAGWHLVQLIEKRRVDYTKEAQLNDIRDMIYQRKFEEHLQSWLQQVRGTAHVNVLVKVD